MIPEKRNTDTVSAMSNKEIVSAFKELKCCIIIPTYNNCTTLPAVIEKLFNYTFNIIVVNDGSTDGTDELLKKYEDKIDIINFKKNGGKGGALRKGFRFALEKKYAYAVTIDSDGQHLPEDIPVFLRKIMDEPGSIIIGARNMEQAGVPKKSSFGNRFSNFWFKLETGITLADTQSGYRLYPLEYAGRKRFFTSKFEFEIEVLVRGAWNNIRIVSVPVHVIYQKDEERVTHFRPFRDFSRISVLNTVFVTWALVYIKPRNFFKSLTPANIKAFVKKNIYLKDESAANIALSVAFGLFMGIAPVWGYQLIIAIAVATFLKLNRFIVVAAANISIPPFIPVIIYLSYLTGGLVLSGKVEAFSYSSAVSFEFIRQNLIQYIIGSIVFGFVTALTGGILFYIPLKLYRKEAEI